MMAVKLVGRPLFIFSIFALAVLIPLQWLGQGGSPRQSMNYIALLRETNLGSPEQEGHSSTQKELDIRLVSADRSDHEFNRLIGQAYLSNGQVEEGVPFLLLAAQQGDQLASFILGDWYLKDRDWSSAVQYLDGSGVQSYRQVRSEVDRLAKENDEDSAIELLSAYVTLHPDVAEAYYRLADLYFVQGDRQSAAGALSRGLEYDPSKSSKEYGYQSARLYYWEEDYDRAVSVLTGILSTDTGYFQAYYLLGQVYLAMEKPQEAEMVLKQALQLEPSQAWVHYFLARAYRDQSKLLEAAGELRTASQLLPKEAAFLEALLKVYQGLGFGCYEVGVTALIKLQTQNPNLNLAHEFIKIDQNCDLP
jgi:tetratricopeptide (TPR) repeat protein